MPLEKHKERRAHTHYLCKVSSIEVSYVSTGDRFAALQIVLSSGVAEALPNDANIIPNYGKGVKQCAEKTLLCVDRRRLTCRKLVLAAFENRPARAGAMVGCASCASVTRWKRIVPMRATGRLLLQLRLARSARRTMNTLLARTRTRRARGHGTFAMKPPRF